MDEDNKLNPYYKSFKIATIQNICDKLPIVNNLKNIFENLKKLNSILPNIIPAHLVEYCHIGAINTNKNSVVLFVTDQQAFHLLRSFSGHILQSFYNNGFHFDSIHIKVSLPASPAHTVQINKKNGQQFRKYENIANDPKRKQALIRLAIAIGRPELIDDNIIPDDNDLKTLMAESN